MADTHSSPERDFADSLPDRVADLGDGQDATESREEPWKLSPKNPAPDSTEEVYDRSVILSHDGRVVAGWALRFIIIVAATALALYLLSFVWIGLLPVLLAILVSTVLWPVARWLRNKKVPAALASLITLLGFLILIVGVFAAMAPTIRSQGREVFDQASEGVDTLLQWVQGPPLNLDLEAINFDQISAEIVSFVQGNTDQILSGVGAGISAATTVAATLVIMFVVTFFILKDGDRFLPMVRRYAGSRGGWHLSEVLTRSWKTLSGFIQTQAVVSFVDAFFIGIGLVLLDVPMAFVLAVITFFGGFIPIVGAFTAGALAVLVALVINGFTNALLVLGLILVVQQVEGNVLQPLLQSRAMNLHAAVVLLSVTVGSALFGIIGAFLAVPIAAVVAVFIRYHAEMVSLRAGEITVDDVEIATAKGQSMSSREALLAVRDHLKQMGSRKPRRQGSTAASSSEDLDIAEAATTPDLTDANTDGTVPSDQAHGSTPSTKRTAD